VGARVVAMAATAARCSTDDGMTRCQGRRRRSGGGSEGVEGDCRQGSAHCHRGQWRSCGGGDN
jgi:hypothetical protein